MNVLQVYVYLYTYTSYLYTYACAFMHSLRCSRQTRGHCIAGCAPTPMDDPAHAAGGGWKAGPSDGDEQDALPRQEAPVVHIRQGPTRTRTSEEIQNQLLNKALKHALAADGAVNVDGTRTGGGGGSSSSSSSNNRNSLRVPAKGRSR